MAIIASNPIGYGILNDTLIIEEKNLGIGQKIVGIKNNNGVGGPTITGDTYFTIQGTGDTGGALGTSIITSQIISRATTIDASNFGSTLEFWTHPQSIGDVSALRMQIKNNGNIEMYTPDAGTADQVALRIFGNSATDPIAAGIVRQNLDTLPASFGFYKVRGTGIINSGDNLGLIGFYGNDGIDSQTAGAYIYAITSGTIAENQIPTTLYFSTHPDSAASAPSVRMKIWPAGGLYVYTPDSGVGLTVAGGGVTSTGQTHLTSLTTGVMQTNATGIVSSTSGSSGQLLIGATGMAPAWANIVSSSGTVVVTNGINSIDLACSPGGLAWVDATGATQPMLPNHGYRANRGAGNVAFSLPAVAARDTIIRIVGIQNGWSVTQAAGQQIFFGNTQTTLGAGGSLASTHARDCIEMICVTANTAWQITGNVQGNITVV